MDLSANITNKNGSSFGSSHPERTNASGPGCIKILKILGDFLQLLPGGVLPYKGLMGT